MDEALYRRRLRLGALLFQLRYYMQTPEDIAADIYRYDADTYVQLTGERVRFIGGGHDEIMDLEGAIARCKTALKGRSLQG